MPQRSRKVRFGFSVCRRCRKSTGIAETRAGLLVVVFMSSIAGHEYKGNSQGGRRKIITPPTPKLMPPVGRDLGRALIPGQAKIPSNAPKPAASQFITKLPQTSAWCLLSAPSDGRGEGQGEVRAVLSNLLAILSLIALKPRLNGSNHQQTDRMFGGIL